MIQNKLQEFRTSISEQFRFTRRPDAYREVQPPPPPEPCLLSLRTSAALAEASVTPPLPWC